MTFETQNVVVESQDLQAVGRRDSTRCATYSPGSKWEWSCCTSKGGGCLLLLVELGSEPRVGYSLLQATCSACLASSQPQLSVCEGSTPPTTTKPVKTATMSDIKPNDHRAYMELALSLARKSPPKPTNYRVGAVVVDQSTNQVLAHGYTLELEGNTHAEQCCLIKLAEAHRVQEERLAQVLPKNLALYTTVEPCSKRLSGNMPCAERILRLAGVIRTVYVGVMEPKKFVAENTGREALEKAGIQFVHVEGLEDEILNVARAGHEPQEE